MDALIFYISGLVSLVAAGIVVTRKNPVYSAIFLVLFFAMVSLDFLILRAPFLAVAQVLIYAGAIMVLFLFVIMLLNLTPEELRENISRERKIMAGAFSLLFFFLLASAIYRSPTVRSAPDLTGEVAADIAQAGETGDIGESLFSTHALAFEFSSVLLLIAIIGAIYLTKKRKTAPLPEKESQAASAGTAAEATKEGSARRESRKEPVA